MQLLLSFILAFLAAGSLYAPAERNAPPAHDEAIGLQEFRRLMTTLSEPEGYFDSDNFVSNELAYLKILPALRRQRLAGGGAYVGVGPDQNYSYLAELQPRLAIIVDIRRQNALQHLYFKALFQLAADRTGYLERLFGRPLDKTADQNEASIGTLLERVDEAPAAPAFARQKLDEALQAVRSWNIGMSSEDLKAIEYVGQAFIDGGPDLKFTSYNRAPRPNHPTYRSLLEETDPTGVQANYLAQESRFQAVRKLHSRHRIVPVVGDLGGVSAMQRIAQELRRRSLSLSCFYVSNVEFYLFHGPRWRRYVRNLDALPWASNGCIVRSYANMWQQHPAQTPGYYMATVAQLARDFLRNEADGKNVTYWDVVTRDYLIR